MAKITTAKLKKLHDHFQSGGSEDGEDIAALLGIDTDDLPEWEAAYKLYAESLEPSVVEQPVLKVWYREDTGLLRELEVISRKGNAVYVQDKVAKDLVTVRLRGRDVVLDVIALGKLPKASVVEPHGLSAERLILLAEAAR